MSDTVVHVDFSKPIPLFPLQPCVLLPHASVPLHIFEQLNREARREHPVVPQAGVEVLGPVIGETDPTGQAPLLGRQTNLHSPAEVQPTAGPSFFGQ